MPRHRTATLVVVVALLAAGCIGGNGVDTGPIGDYEVEVFNHPAGPLISGGITPVDVPTPEKFYVTVVEDGASPFNGTIMEYVRGMESFVANTSFEDSYLVAIQTYPESSTPNYRVESLNRTDDGLRVGINDSGRVSTADITIKTVLIRVPQDDPVPDVVTVTTEEGIEFDSSMGVVTDDELQDERTTRTDQ